jgi:hypothetical protein
VFTKHENFIGGITMSVNTDQAQSLQNVQAQPPVLQTAQIPVQAPAAQQVPLETTSSLSAVPGRIFSNLSTYATQGWNWVRDHAQPAVNAAREPVSSLYNSASTNVQSIASRVNTYVSSKWEEYSTLVQNKANEWDQKLVSWSDLYIGKRYAPIFRRAIYSLPVTLTQFCLPSQIFWSAIGAYAITHAVAKNKDLLSPTTYRLIHDGLGFGGVVETVKAVAEFILTRKPESAVSIVLSTAWATFWFTRSAAPVEQTSAQANPVVVAPHQNPDQPVVQPQPVAPLANAIPPVVVQPQQPETPVSSQSGENIQAAPAVSGKKRKRAQNIPAPAPQHRYGTRRNVKQK